MKPPPFAYHAPRTIDEALALLDECGDDAKLLAGGQSLIPLLNFRLARPSVVIDLNRVAGLNELRRENGALHIGAMTRTALLERSSLVAEFWPILREAAGHIGHTAIRNRGTVGGSVAHADPTAELPVVLTALDARLHVRSRAGARTIPAAAFFVGRLTTALAPNELLVGIEVRPLAERTQCGFAEYARTAGDFALAGACASITRDEAGTCAAAAIALLGAGSVPVRATDAERALVGTGVDARAIAAAAELVVATCRPPEPVAHRRALLGEMTRRALERAVRGAA